MECGGRRFESSHPDHLLPLSLVGRASLSESEGPRFEAASGYQLRIKLSREARAVMGRSAKPEKTSSTPVRASNWLQWLEWTGARFLLGSMRVRILLGAPNACVAQRMSARILDHDPIKLNRDHGLLEHDLFRKPVPTPDQVRGRLFRDHALSGMTLVRLQSQAPMTTLIWRVNRRGLRRRLLSGRSVRR